MAKKKTTKMYEDLPAIKSEGYFSGMSKRIYKDIPTLKSDGHFSEMVIDEQSGDKIEVIYKASIVDASEFECCSVPCMEGASWRIPFEDLDVRILHTNLNRIRELTNAIDAELTNLYAGLSYMSFLRDDFIKTLNSCRNIFEQPARGPNSRVNGPASKTQKPDGTNCSRPSRS